MTKEQRELAAHWHECLMSDLECIRGEAHDQGMKVEHIVLMSVSPIDSTRSKHSMNMEGSYNGLISMLMDMLKQNPEMLLMLSKSIVQHKQGFIAEALGESAREQAAKGFEAMVKALNDDK